MNLPGQSSSPQAYLTEQRPRFWRWESDAIAWSSGSTLTFHEELLSILDRLQPLGFPPFPAILLFIGLTRSGLSPSSSLTELSESSQGTSPFWGLSLPQRASLCAVAERILDLARQPGFHPQFRAALGEILFEDAPHRLTPDSSQRILELLRKGYRPPPNQDSTEGDSPDRGAFTSPLAAFLRIDPATLTLERLQLRAATGVDCLVHVEEKSENPAALKGLLRRLEADPALRGLARLTRNLGAILHLPRNLGDPGHSPAGGVSDVATHGEPQSLLLSELAQDDFILASRIAQGEALYLRRERPPAEPAPGRWILLDTGLRLWGIPRIRALATALAVVSITAARNACRVFAPCQGDLEALTLSDPEGLLRALSLLNTHLSPEPYLHQIGSCIDGQKGDFVFITHRAIAPTSLECLPALARPDLTCYVITVDASDLIECSVITRSGTFLRQSIEQQLELIYDAAAAHPLFCGEPSEALT